MKLISYTNTCMARGPRPPQFKSNNLFNEHFPYVIFFKSILSRKNWKGVGEWLFQNGTIDGC